MSVVALSSHLGLRSSTNRYSSEANSCRNRSNQIALKREVNGAARGTRGNAAEPNAAPHLMYNRTATSGGESAERACAFRCVFSVSLGGEWKRSEREKRMRMRSANIPLMLGERMQC